MTRTVGLGVFLLLLASSYADAVPLPISRRVLIRSLSPVVVQCDEATQVLNGQCSNTLTPCTTHADCGSEYCMPSSPNGLPICTAAIAASQLHFGAKGRGRVTLTMQPKPNIKMRVKLRDVRTASETLFDGTVAVRLSFRPTVTADTNDDSIPDTLATVPDFPVEATMSIHDGHGFMALNLADVFPPGSPITIAPGMFDVRLVDVVDGTGAIFATTSPLRTTYDARRVVAGCTRLYDCTLGASSTIYVASYCCYSCVFSGDAPIGCSGLTPGVTIRSHCEAQGGGCYTRMPLVDPPIDAVPVTVP